MTAGQSDERPAVAAGHGHIRASHADREHVIDMLKVAFVQGRLSKDELDSRTGLTFASRTYGELAALTADLPPDLVMALPGGAGQVWDRLPAHKVAAIVALVVPPPVMVMAAVLTRSDLVAHIAFQVVTFYLLAWIAAVAQLIVNRHDKRSGKQLPQATA